VRRQARAEADRARDAIPDLASILVLAVHAGLNAPLGLRAVAPATSGIVRTALDEVERRHQAGERFADALTALDQLEGAPAHAIVRALTDHLRDGTALVPALERAANDLRADRRRRAEARARRAPVALLFPLVTCIFPAFVLLTVVPLLAGALAELHL
jgi:tight adherence protein C